MAPTLRLKTSHTPSLINEDMALGAFIGTFAAPVVGTLVGGLIGGLIGKHTQEKENRVGKPVGTPTFWNKDAMLGGFIGNFLGIVVGVSLMMIAGVSSPVVPIGATIAALGSLVIGTTLGIYLGGKSGEARMAHELEEARQQHMLQYVGRTVTMEILNELATGNGWSKRVEEERQKSPEKAL